MKCEYHIRCPYENQTDECPEDICECLHRAEYIRQEDLIEATTTTDDGQLIHLLIGTTHGDKFLNEHRLV